MLMWTNCLGVGPRSMHILEYYSMQTTLLYPDFRTMLTIQYYVLVYLSQWNTSRHRNMLFQGLPTVSEPTKELQILLVTWQGNYSFRIMRLHWSPSVYRVIPVLTPIIQATICCKCFPLHQLWELFRHSQSIFIYLLLLSPVRQVWSLVLSGQPTF